MKNNRHGKSKSTAAYKGLLITFAFMLALVGPAAALSTFFPAASVFAAGAESGMIITDMASREVRLEKIARRVLAVNSASRFIAYLGCAEALAGIENIDKNFINTRAYTIALRDVFKKLPAVGEGGAGKPLDLEKIISLKPDVIFEAFNDREAAEPIQSKTGLKVVSLSYGDKSWYDESVFFASLNTAAKVMGRETRAAELINYVGSLNADLAKRAAANKNGRRARCYIGAVSFRGRQGIISTDSMYTPFIKAGAENAVSEAGANSHVFLDREKLLVYDPEYIFIDAAGLSMVSEDYLKNRSYYQRLSAVRNKKVYLCLPSVFYYLNIETLYINSYFVGKIINPEAFSDIDPAAKADEIFEKFCGAKCYEAINREYGAFSRLEFGEKVVSLEK